MKPEYILKEVCLGAESREKDGLQFVIREGDIILDKGSRFEVLPAKFDFTKPITGTKVSNAPEKPSERLLRIKELGEDRAVVAILKQEVNFEGTDTLVTVEKEHLKTVKYGEKFCIYAKEQFQVFDSPCAIIHEFIIAEESKQQEQKAPKFCSECGNKLIMGDKFCRECGTPVLRIK